MSDVVPGSKLGAVIGARTAEALASSLGLVTVADLLGHYPRRYQERGELTPISQLSLGEHVTVLASVAKVVTKRTRAGKPMVEITVTDATSGRLTLTFFNQAWRAQQLPVGTRALFSGQVTEFRGVRQLSHPVYQRLEGGEGVDNADVVDAFAGSLIPIYPASSAAPTWVIARAIAVVLDVVDLGPDPLPAVIVTRHGLLDHAQALRTIHRPRTKEEVAEAKRRLKWDEALVLETVLARRRARAEARPATSRPPVAGGLAEAFIDALPFTLTAGQQQVIDAVAADLARDRPMHRLLQGEVGSGKAQPDDARVLTPHGFTPLGSIRPGDLVVAADGSAVPVISVHPQGARPVAELVTVDGAVVRCDVDHLWQVTVDGQDELLTTGAIAREISSGRNVDLPRAAPVDLAPSAGPLAGSVADRQLRALRSGLRPGARLAAGDRDGRLLALSLGHLVIDGVVDDPRECAPRRVAHVRLGGPSVPMRCILIDHPRHLYVTDDFVVTHNTVVAVAGMLQVVDNGGQAALLAPTEVLAGQHARSLRTLLGPLADGALLGGERATNVGLLTGSQPAPERRRVLAALADGELGIVVGTHALIQDPVAFHDLGVIVVDEQHRFGVEQRDALRGKADAAPHLLVMTATPIPRTVAMTVFGDLDISTLTELPRGRAGIDTVVVPADRPDWVARTWTRVREEAALGRQAFVVCPRIGDEDPDELADADAAPPADVGDVGDEEDGSGGGSASSQRPASAAVERTWRLLADGPLSGLRVAALHGRMPADDKDRVMTAMAAGDIDVLVATTVIEVGVDVPNASVMVVLDADRFGISQLHQLRGRVGRGTHPSLCLLVSGAPEGSAGRARLDALAATGDGFELARVDLEQRREGDVLGVAQSGRRTRLRLLTLLDDEELIAQAQQEARGLVDADPTLAAVPLLAAAADALERGDGADYLEKA